MILHTAYTVDEGLLFKEALVTCQASFSHATVCWNFVCEKQAGSSVL